jgi:alkylation response protein AidB-like acyl-CoA dehydrogenase
MWPAKVGTSVEAFRDSVREVFRHRVDVDRMGTSRGMPPFVLREALSTDPLALFIPKEHGGAGAPTSAALALLDAAAYESLALSTILAINGLLFLHPVAKYGQEQVKGPVFRRFLEDKALGGLMLTEPGAGSDLTNMQATYRETSDGYHLAGVKHWAGLTGWADFWLLAARRKAGDGSPSGAPEFFLCDIARPGQQIVVEESFNNLGLYMIPYGRNLIDVTVPTHNRLSGGVSGLRVLLDVLYRSRLHFPAIAAGFVRRVLDEAIKHCDERHVGGASLSSYDQVKNRVARLQAAFTACSAMCIHATAHGGLERDLSKDGTVPNALKAVCTDLMHESAQSLLQLVGAKGYRLDHFAGRAVVDSRPFQILEGSNDILYDQVGESVILRMAKSGESNLLRHLRSYSLTSRASEYFKSALDVRVDAQMAQRKTVALGQAVSRLITMDLVLGLGDRGFRRDLVDGCIQVFRHDVEGLLVSYRTTDLPVPVADYGDGPSWIKVLGE